MGRSPCCDHEKNVKKGPWTPEEDQKLIDYVTHNGPGSWQALPKLAGLNRCGKSCRLRWTNYLRPDIRRGNFSDHEENLIISLHAVLGNRWSKIASHLEGRTDNEIKNYWNTHIRKKLLRNGIDPNTHKPRTDLNLLSNLSQLISAFCLGNPFGSSPSLDSTALLKLQVDAARIQLLQNLMLQIVNTSSSANFPPKIDVNNVLKSLLVSPTHFANTFQSVSSEMMTTTNQERFTPRSSSGGFGDTPGLSEANRSSGYELPALVSVSADNNNSIMNQVEGKDNYMAAMYSSSEMLPSVNQPESCKAHPKADISPDVSDSSIFQTWERLLEDETSDTCWKSFLDLTASTSSADAW